MPGLDVIKRLAVEVIGDTSKADRSLNKLGDSASSGSGWGKKLALGGSVAFAAIGAGATAAGGWGLKLAADAETASIGFTTLLGSGEKAAGFMKELQAFAAKTPFEFPELRDAASRLLAVGTATKDVIPLMSALGDATSGMGTGAEGINRAVTALTQMQQKGKVTGEEMLQLAEAGIPAWDALATKLGTDVAGAQAQVTKGLVKAPVLFEALEQRAGPAMGRLTGLMDKQSQSLSGLLSTLKDTAGQALAGMLAPAVQAIKGQLPAVTDAISGTLTAIGPQVASFMGGLVNLLGGLLPALGPIIGLVAQLAGAFGDALGPALSALAPYLSLIAGTLGGALVDAIKVVGPALQPLVVMFGSGLAKVAGVVANIIGELAPIFGELLDAVLPLLEPLGTLVSEVLASVVPVIKPMLSPFIGLIKVLVGTAGAAGPLVKAAQEIAPLFGELLHALVPLTAPLANVVQQLVVGLLPAIKPLLAPIVSLATSLVGTTDSAGPLVQILNLVAGVLAKLPPAVFLAIAAALIAWQAPVLAVVAGVALLVAAFTKFLPFITDLWKKISGAFMAGIGWVRDHLATAARIWLAVTTGGMSELVRFIAGHWRQIVDGARDFVGNVVGFFTGLPGRILGALGDLSHLLWDAGVSIITGLWHGLESMGGWIADKVGGLIKKVIPGPVKKILHIGSPSKVMAGFGADAARGLARGMVQMAPVVRDAAGVLAGAVATPVTLGATGPGLAATRPSTLPPGGLAGGGVTWTGDVVIEGTLTAERDLVQRLRKEFIRLGDVNGGNVFAGQA